MNSSSQQFEDVAAHYSRSGLEAEIMAALVTAGKDPDNLKPEDLAPFDEFHIR
ncbi:MAG: SAM-dependent methyltransferase, partial [Deltaproteobacteria bacterium]|nr:SAM-dependent methyltransferase [Deltaproteobacteria bacterium]